MVTATLDKKFTGEETKDNTHWTEMIRQCMTLQILLISKTNVKIEFEFK